MHMISNSLYFSQILFFSSSNMYIKHKLQIYVIFHMKKIQTGEEGRWGKLILGKVANRSLGSGASLNRASTNFAPTWVHMKISGVTPSSQTLYQKNCIEIHNENYVMILCYHEILDTRYMALG